MSLRAATRCLACAMTFALALPHSAVASSSGPTAAAIAGDAKVAYEEAVALDRKGNYDEAVSKLDYASELEPTWTAPVELRADVFGKLARKHKPSAVFMSARADDLERLLVLEPGVDVAARKHEIATLRQRSEKARRTERRHRKLMAPAAVFLTGSLGFAIAGAMLYGMKPRPALEPSAYRQERRDRAGIALMAAGAALAPAAIVLSVLAFRQARRDSAVRDFEVETGRRRPTIAVVPTMSRRGGGVGLALRF